MAGSNASGAAFRATGRLRAIATASSVVVLAASAAFSAMSPMLAVASSTVVAAALGLGVGIGMPVSNFAAQTGADPADAGRATSMAMFFRGFGGTVSVAACGILAPAATAAGTAAVFGAVCVAAVAGRVAVHFEGDRLVGVATSWLFRIDLTLLSLSGYTSLAADRPKRERRARGIPRSAKGAKAQPTGYFGGASPASL